MLGPSWGNTGNFFFKPPRPLAIACRTVAAEGATFFRPTLGAKIITGEDFKLGAQLLPLQSKAV
jgi:hypothetical protein